MRSTLAATTCLVATLLAGCSDDNAGTPPPKVGTSAPTSASSSGSASPSATGTASADGVFDVKGHVAFPGRHKVKGPEQRAVADAWMAYWQVRLDAFYAAEVDPTALGEVATGEAASDVVSYAADLKQRKQHVDGDLRMTVDTVKITGDKATLTACEENRTQDRAANGRPTEPLTPFYAFRASLSRVSDSWRVASLERTGSSPC
jgi:hypothetical protein